MTPYILWLRSLVAEPYHRCRMARKMTHEESLAFFGTDIDIFRAMSIRRYGVDLATHLPSRERTRRVRRQEARDQRAQELRWCRRMSQHYRTFRTGGWP
jgi:hypothetical protein